MRIFLYVFSSIAGAGVLMFPTTVIGNGINVVYALLGSFALFCPLGYLFSKTNDPFESIKVTCPDGFYKFMTLLYWVFTWTGTILSIYEMANAILSFTNCAKSYGNILCLQFVIITAFIGLHRIGMHRLKVVEIVINWMKMIILFVLPVIFIFYGVKKGATVNMEFNASQVSTRLPAMMWAFLGVESCAIGTQSKNLTKPVVAGLTGVLAVYVLHMLSILLTMNSMTDFSAPHAWVMNQITGSVSVLPEKIVALCVIILCAGSVNAWYYISASIFQSLKHVGNYNTTYFRSIVCGSIGLYPLALITSSPHVREVYDKAFSYFSIIGALFYVVCAYSICKKGYESTGQYRYPILGTLVCFGLTVFACYQVYSMVRIFFN